jgi:hypothetical protein
MNTHKNARLTFARRLEMGSGHHPPRSDSGSGGTHGVSMPTVRKWLGAILRRATWPCATARRVRA